MKKEQLAERIGNIDAEFIQDAEHIPNYTKQHKKKVVRRLSVFAAVIALMVCSIGVGAVAFAKETIVEVPAEQEKIVLDKIGLTIILPDEWKGKYGVERNEDGTGCAVYVKDIHDGNGEWAGLGYLFWIGQASTDKPVTQRNYMHGHRLLAFTFSQPQMLHICLKNIVIFNMIHLILRKQSYICP